jgi:Mg2+ and Co2+ transporter CorA
MLADVDVRLITENGAERHDVSEIADLLVRRAGFVWVDIASCDDEAVRVLSDVFRFHPLAVKDCVERNRVPKMLAGLSEQGKTLVADTADRFTGYGASRTANANTCRASSSSTRAS